MSQIAGFAKGLLSLLDSQSFGESPKVLGDTIVPVVSIEELYLLQKQTTVVSIVGAPVNNLNPNAIPVPSGEVWRIHAGGIFMLNPVAVTNGFAPVINIDGGVIPLGPLVASPASASRWAPMTCGPFWLSAGGTLAAYGSELVGVPTSVSIAFLVSKLRA